MNTKRSRISRMERIVKVAKNYQEAEDWDILQHIQMTPAERQQVVTELKRRVYGQRCPDIRKVR
jgi:hypothetical protein